MAQHSVTLTAISNVIIASQLDRFVIPTISAAMEHLAILQPENVARVWVRLAELEMCAVETQPATTTFVRHQRHQSVWQLETHA